MRPITELDSKYLGETLWVIGRGPSLARLTAADIGPGPVVAINQAINQVEQLAIKNPLYSMQKDRYFGRPARSLVLLHARESAIGAPENMGNFVFDCEQDFGFPWNVPSVVVCAGLARRWGCSRVVYLCCDAATHGDTGAYGDQPTYPANYLVHAPMVRRYARLPVEYKRL